MSLIHLEHSVYLVPTEPRHFIQYDMGEDRWLCTLLLKQGWRVEYSAASGNFNSKSSQVQMFKSKYACFNSYENFQIHILLLQKVLRNFITREEDGCHLLCLILWIVCF